MLDNTTVTGIPTPSASPGPPLCDLSTIIESETSGISKHLPNLDDEREWGGSTIKGSTTPPRPVQSASVGSNDVSMLHPDRSYIGADGGDTSALDLSTSGLTAEVLNAMMVKDVLVANDWLKGVDGVVVDDVAGSPPKIGGLIGGEQGSHLSFNFGSLDPDLAALLSPHKGDTNDQTMFGIKASLAPSPSMSSTSPHKFEHLPSRGLTRTVPPSPSPSKPSDGHLPPDMYSTDAQSSPATRRSASLTRSTASHRPTSLSALPRLAHPIAALATPFRQGNDLTGSVSTSPQSSPDGND